MKHYSLELELQNYLFQLEKVFRMTKWILLVDKNIYFNSWIESSLILARPSTKYTKIHRESISKSCSSSIRSTNEFRSWKSICRSFDNYEKVTTCLFCLRFPCDGFILFYHLIFAETIVMTYVYDNFYDWALAFTILRIKWDIESCRILVIKYECVCSSFRGNCQNFLGLLCEWKCVWHNCHINAKLKLLTIT